MATSSLSRLARSVLDGVRNMSLSVVSPPNAEDLTEVTMDDGISPVGVDEGAVETQETSPPVRLWNYRYGMALTAHREFVARDSESCTEEINLGWDSYDHFWDALWFVVEHVSGFDDDEVDPSGLTMEFFGEELRNIFEENDIYLKQAFDNAWMSTSTLERKRSALRNLRGQVWMRMKVWSSGQGQAWTFLESFAIKWPLPQTTPSERIHQDIRDILEHAQRVARGMDLDDDDFQDWVVKTLTVGGRIELDVEYRAQDIVQHFAPKAHQDSDDSSEVDEATCPSSGVSDCLDESLGDPPAVGTAHGGQGDNTKTQTKSKSRTKGRKKGKKKRVRHKSRAQKTWYRCCKMHHWGSRKVRNKNTDFAPDESTRGRTCVADAVCSLLPELDDEFKKEIFQTIVRRTPEDRDTSIYYANQALAHHGYQLQRTLGDPVRGGLEYNLLQLRDCRKVLCVQLKNYEGQCAYHCIAWDGNTLWDRPDAVRVNNTTGRASRKSVNDVFERLFHPRYFAEYSVLQVYDLIEDDSMKGYLD